VTGQEEEMLIFTATMSRSVTVKRIGVEDCHMGKLVLSSPYAITLHYP